MATYKRHLPQIGSRPGPDNGKFSLADMDVLTSAGYRVPITEHGFKVVNAYFRLVGKDYRINEREFRAWARRNGLR